MIFTAASAAFRQLFSPPFRAVLLKSLGLTLLVLAVLWFALKRAFDWFALPWIDALLPANDWTGWVNLLTALLAGIGIALVLALLIAPVTAVVAGFFLDDIAATVERESYPDDPPGAPVPTLASIVMALKFFGVVILGNLVALFLLIIPGVNIAAFFIVNGYLLGREFFEFAAMRFWPEADAKALRRRHAGTVFFAGLIIAAFLAVPFLNLLTPLFAAAMMVHVHKTLAWRARLRSRRPD